MRITSWAKGWLLCAVLVVGPVVGQSASAGGVTLTSTVVAGRTLLRLHGEHVSSRAIVLRRDATVARSGTPPVLRLVGEIRGKAILLTDTYPSAALGLSFCQAGEEQFVRVVRIAGTKPREAFHLKIASCRDNIELADSGVEWVVSTRTLTIHWLQPPAGQPAMLTLSLDTNGQAQAAVRTDRP